VLRTFLLILLWGALGGGMLRTAVGQGVGPMQSEVSVFGAAASTESLPFWLDANQFGKFDREGATLRMRLAARRSFPETRDGLDYSVGLDVLGRASRNSTFHAQELYGQLRYGRLKATAGWKKRTIGRVDTARSLGGITLSKNATPLPKPSVSTTGYVPVPGTNNVLGVNLYMDHGWMEEERFVSNALLHEKYGYLRIVPLDSPVTLHTRRIHHAF
jgi:hypothetical protein